VSQPTSLRRRSLRRLIETKVADRQIDEVWRILWREVYPTLSRWEKLKFRFGWWFDRFARFWAAKLTKVIEAR
jgi:hypothetical protein